MELRLQRCNDAYQAVYVDPQETGKEGEFFAHLPDTFIWCAFQTSSLG
jgi:hypothetical protein